MSASAPLCPPLASHPRERLPIPACDSIIVHGPLAVLKGDQEGLRIKKSDAAKAYQAAKFSNDMSAAMDLVDMVWDEGKEDAIIDRLMDAGKRPIYVLPHPAFDDEDAIDGTAGMRDGPVNAIPFAHAARLAEAIGGEIDNEITQKARVGRTKLNRFQRFLWQPSFVGDISTDRPYVLVDDAFTLGGTLANLASYILAGGGTIACATALAHKAAKDVPFALTQDTLYTLKTEYGPDIDRFWKDAIGHEAAKLTDAEGSFLVDWWRSEQSKHDGYEGLQLLRNRLLKVRDQGE